MRRLFSAFKAFVLTALVAACVFFAYALAHAPAFTEGERYEFYTGTSSDTVLLSRSPLDKLFLAETKGESVRYHGDRAQEILQKFDAEVLFIEEAAGITNYYCYSPALKNELALNGKRVNLHVACDGRETAAGTPLIFGGF